MPGLEVVRLAAGVPVGSRRSFRETEKMKTSSQKPSGRKGVAVAVGDKGQAYDPTGQPAYSVRLPKEEVEKLLPPLTADAGSDRRWFTLTATSENWRRLRLTTRPSPAFEAQAGPLYLRGDALRVSGKKNSSVNIDFSGEVAHTWLASKLRAALDRARRFVELRIPNRWNNKDLIELWPDTDLEAAVSPEHQKLADAGTALVNDVWPNDDFSDWETTRVG